MGLTALSLVFLGAKHGDDRLLHRSKTCYNMLLQRLGVVKGITSDIIEAAIILSVYELYSPFRSMESWMLHVRGAYNLVRDYGLDKRLDPHLLCLIRTCAFYDSCGRRKSTFFAEPQWRAISPKNEPFENLLNILFSLPSIRETCDHLQHASTKYSHAQVEKFRDQFLFQFATTYADLRSWYLNWLEQYDDCPFTLRLALPCELSFPGNNPDANNSYPSVFTFSDNFNFQLMLLCWTGFLVLHFEAATVMRTIQDTLDLDFPSHEAYGPSPETISRSPWFEDECNLTSWPVHPSEPVQTATHKVDSMSDFFSERLCQAMAFCGGYSWGSAIKFPAFAPLWLMKELFKTRSPQRSLWCQEVLRRFHRKDRGYGQTFAGLSADDYLTT